MCPQAHVDASYNLIPCVHKSHCKILSKILGTEYCSLHVDLVARVERTILLEI